MSLGFTEKTLRQFVTEISDQYYALTETVIAASAAQAAALGEACMQISLDNQVDKLDWQDITARIEQMSHIKDTLLEWCNQEIAPVSMPPLATEGDTLQDHQQVLCDYSAEIGRYSVEAALLLQDFRPFVFDPLQDDLEMTINLLAGVAQAALLLLDSKLQRQPDKVMLEEYSPLRDEIQDQIGRLKLINHLGNKRP